MSGRDDVPSQVSRELDAVHPLRLHLRSREYSVVRNSPAVTLPVEGVALYVTPLRLHFRSRE
eukprot:19233-Prorocentrum_minimum.AAC.2